jgi:hypothetical protein
MEKKERLARGDPDRPVRFLYFAMRQDWEKNDGIKRTVE